MKSLMVSDPEYERFNTLWNMYAMAKNPHLHTQCWEDELELENNSIEFKIEMKELLETLEEAMNDLLGNSELPDEFLRGIMIIPEKRDFEV